jgi:hypothetical protein
MFAHKIALRSLALVLAALSMAACKNGGQVTIASTNSSSTEGSPFVQVNQGGNTMIVQQGQTPTTGVHGWVTIQAITSSNLSSSDGSTNMVMNRSQAVR